MRPQGSEKKQTDEDRKLDRILSTSSLLLSILCCIAIFHMELRIQEHRRLISHSSSGTFRDEIKTEILRKVQQECGSWRETKESYLKGDWQTTTFCYVLCSPHLFACGKDSLQLVGLYLHSLTSVLIVLAIMKGSRNISALFLASEA